MRAAPLITLSLLIACSPLGSANESAGQSEPVGSDSRDTPAATISVASNTAGNCIALWNGGPLSQEAIGERGLQLLTKRIDAIGGVAAITQDNLPYLRVEAPPATRWACAGQVLVTLQHTGFGQTLLRSTAAREGPDQRIYLPTGDAGAANPIHVVKIGAGGAVSDDGKLIARTALRELARTAGAGGPDDILIAPLQDASFGDVYQTLAQLRASGAGVMLAPAAAMSNSVVGAEKASPTAFRQRPRAAVEMLNSAGL